MYKSIDELRTAIVRRFERTLHDEAARELLGGEGAWPWRLSLGQVKTAELTSNAPQVSAYIAELRAWCTRFGLGLEYEVRRFGAAQELPARVVVDSVDLAARVAGEGAPKRLRIARSRAAKLVHATGVSVQIRSNPGEVSAVLRRTRDWAEVDFDLLIDAAAWFAEHDATGLTPRQVPLEGFHAKWLDAEGRRAMVARLAGLDDLGLVARPSELSFAYLDPSWCEHGRHYDSYVVGDVACLAYTPQFVLVVENKDSYLWFPQVKGGICAFGGGKAGPAVLGRVPWVRSCPTLLYWGDMDADGLEILNAYRAEGLNVTSVLMDRAAYDRYERFGTRRAAGKRDLAEHVRTETPYLTPNEQELYDLLCDPTWQGALRIEQERIPLQAAHVEVLKAAFPNCLELPL